MFFGFVDPRKTRMPDPSEALPGRDEPIVIASPHAVLGSSLHADWDGMEQIQVGMGCFWGAERKFWTHPGVVSTAVGYAAGFTRNPTYEEVCSGQTGHNEVVRIVFDPTQTTVGDILKIFWESHNPTQGMRQGNDVGTQYRSGIYVYSDGHHTAAQQSKEEYQERLTEAGYGEITTEILTASPFFFAEDYHQQYLHKNPGGYCGLGGTGVSCPAEWTDTQ